MFGPTHWVCCWTWLVWLRIPFSFNWLNLGCTLFSHFWSLFSNSYSYFCSSWRYHGNLAVTDIYLPHKSVHLLLQSPLNGWSRRYKFHLTLFFVVVQIILQCICCFLEGLLKGFRLSYYLVRPQMHPYRFISQLFLESSPAKIYQHDWEIC